MSEKEFKKDKLIFTIIFSIFINCSILGIVNSLFIENISKFSYIVMCLITFVCSSLLLFITSKITLQNDTNSK